MAHGYADDPVAGLAPDPRVRGRRGLLALAVGLVYLVGFLLTVAVPFVSNDLHTLPPGEAASGAHDPKDLWPLTTTWGPASQLVAVVVLMTGPLAVLAAGGWAVAALVVRRRVLDGRARAALVAAAVAATAFLALLLSPVGRTMTTWLAD